MKLRSVLMTPAVILIIFGVVVGFLIYGGDTLLGLDSDDINTVIILIPGVIGIFMAFYAVAVSSGYLLAGALAGLGVSAAFMLHLMDETSLIVDEPTLLISDVQILVILVFLVLTVAVAVGVVVKER